MNELKNQWKCEQCGSMNSGNYCVNCGAQKPVEVKKEEETQLEIPKKQEEPIIVPEAETATPVKETAAPAKEVILPAQPKANHVSPVLTAFIAGVIGLGAGYGGGYLAVKQSA